MLPMALSGLALAAIVLVAFSALRVPLFGPGPLVLPPSCVPERLGASARARACSSAALPGNLTVDKLKGHPAS